MKFRYVANGSRRCSTIWQNSQPFDETPYYLA
nr:MAG TPA: hypothetical protein [Caudoviricetes sp.]